MQLRVRAAGAAWPQGRRWVQLGRAEIDAQRWWVNVGCMQGTNGAGASLAVVPPGGARGAAADWGRVDLWTLHTRADFADARRVRDERVKSEGSRGRGVEGSRGRGVEVSRCRGSEGRSSPRNIACHCKSLQPTPVDEARSTSPSPSPSVATVAACMAPLRVALSTHICVHVCAGSLVPFLYPALCRASRTAAARPGALRRTTPSSPRCHGTLAAGPSPAFAPPNTAPSHLDPTPDSYSLTPFADRCIVAVEGGAGGHGCVSFVREKYIEEGPPNGGDGGSGGNVYIQALRGETSLHKLARRRLIKAGRGRNGQGKMRGGERGADVLITVPVGTIVREIHRRDPIAELEAEAREAQWNKKHLGRDEAIAEEEKGTYRKDRWLVFPGMIPSELGRMAFPVLPKPRRSHLAALQPDAPVWLDLDKHMETPMLLAAGSMGGFGNPHFVTPNSARPKMATRGDDSMTLSLQLELKLLADLGLVGLPNAGKSTLLRALSNSRARVGNWAFTTLQPNVGTVVLDNHKGRPAVSKRMRDGALRENFTIADVPGLIEDAHLDKGLGLGFLRHVERAAVLAFVIDLSAGDAVKALRLLWREVSEYEALKGKELNAETEQRLVTYKPPRRSASTEEDVGRLLGQEADQADTRTQPLQPLPFITTSTPISAKPWLVVATKADLPNTQENYASLQQFLSAVNQGEQPHPSNRKNAWRKDVRAVPISAIRAEGVEVIPQLVMDLLEQ
ncbi:GTP-binding protein Obg/CgtA [Amniculicola lignicola CBS 123094]|uniref:GTP-binding protein Obg/CgtA n=1 Tax=Amniculicola lignicola CBS 123094 TaxID=1392246 RepID=A0A6A5W7L2_9PLEO|nr:GTP-binding protein Obg/CgtA [Amniculicola lignicola CBS 123094]